jgi:predicted amidohydrolase
LSADTLRLGIHQFAPRLRAPAENLATIVAAGGELDLLLTPELSLTGYDVGDAAHHYAVPLTLDEPLPYAASATEAALVVGLIEQGADGVPYNAAALVADGVVRFRHRKLYLPTYGMFDEARYFGRGTELDTFELNGWRFGLLVCEDFWHPGLIYALAAAGIDALLVCAAAPGRGVWEGGADGSIFASTRVWERIARTTAQLYGIYVALANRSGVEGAVTFAGGSVVVGPDGEPMAHADHEPALLSATLDRAALRAARRPYAHARDDDPRIVQRALGRLFPS